MNSDILINPEMDYNAAWTPSIPPQTSLS